MILNIHGYMGNQHNMLYKALTAYGVEDKDIYTPQIDYDLISPQHIFNHFSIMIEGARNQANNVELIVANSFGGFFGYMLAAKYKIPILFVNPCLMPFLTIYNISETYPPLYKRELFSLFGEYMGTLPMALCTVIEGNADSVIDHEKLTQPLLTCSRYNFVYGMDHNITDSDYETVRALVADTVEYYKNNGTKILEQVE